MPLLINIKEEHQATWLQQLLQYRLQFEIMKIFHFEILIKNCIFEAAIVFAAGGMKMGWSVYELPSAQYDCYINTNFLTTSWFIGVIFGVFMASFFVGRVTKNVSHILSGVLLVFGGVIFIIMPTTFIAIAFSCICEGTGFGLLQLQAFVTGAEVAHKHIRGLVMSTERCFIWFGILMQLTLTYCWYAVEPTTGHTMHADQIHGIAVTGLGVATILWTLKLRVESPLLLLRQQRHEAADVVLKKLQGPYASYNEMTRMREDCLQLLSMDAHDSCWDAVRTNNMLSLLIMRCFVALCMSQPFNHIYLSASWLGFDCDSNCLYTLTFVGLLGSLVGGTIVDRYGRRKLCVVTLFPAGTLMFAAGGFVHYLKQAEVAIVASDLETVSILLLLFQLIISAGISTTATVYLSEAFTVAQKPKCIAIILVAENLLQILLNIISINMVVSAAILLFVIGLICLQLGLYLFLCMPETKRLTLYECLLKFKLVSLSK